MDAPESPPQWPHVRTDAGARKLVERIDELRTQVGDVSEGLDNVGVQVARLEGRVEQAVTWPKLVAILGGFAGTVITVAALIVNSNSGRSEASLTAAQKQFADDVRQVRAETSGRLDRFEAKQDAVLRVTVEGKSRDVARKELERRTGEHRTREDK